MRHRTASLLLLIAGIALSLNVRVGAAQEILTAFPDQVSNRLTLNGSNLGTTAAVAVGGTIVSVLSVTASQVVTTLPCGATCSTTPMPDGEYLVRLMNRRGRVLASFQIDVDNVVIPPAVVQTPTFGTPRAVPVFIGPNTIGDSRIHDDGAAVTVDVPVKVSGELRTDTLSITGASPVGVSGRGTNIGVSGQGVAGPGVFGSGVIFGVSGQAKGPIGGCCATGVIGSATNSTGTAIGVAGFVDTVSGWGTQGSNSGGGIGVLATSSGGQGIGMSAQSDGGNAIFASSQASGVGSTIYLINNGGGAMIAAQGCAAPDPNNSGLCANPPGSFSVLNDGSVKFSGGLEIHGDALKPDGGSWSTLSDRRTKKSIEPLAGALSQLLRLRGVTYEYADPSAFGERPGTHIGMVAQDVEHVFPSWVDTGTDGYERLTFRGFEAVAVEAMRELEAKEKAAVARIAEVERDNAELRHAVEELSEALKTLQRR